MSTTRKVSALSAVSGMQSGPASRTRRCRILLASVAALSLVHRFRETDQLWTILSAPPYMVG